MARKIAFMNRKGGVGKTTSAVNVAAALALKGKRVLLVDADSQAHATLSLGLRPSSPSLLDALVSPESAKPVKARENLWVFPASPRFSEYEMQAVRDPKNLMRLRRLLSGLNGSFEFVVIDLPPNVGVMTLSSLLAADEVVIPLAPHFLALKGLAETKALVDKVSSKNPGLRITGILPTFFNPKLRHAKAVMEEIRRVFGSDILLPPVRNSVRLAEAPSFAKTIFEYDPSSGAAEDYMKVAEEIMARGGEA